MRRVTISLLCAFGLSALLYAGWTELTRIRGNQTATFAPSNAKCDTVGQLRYCIFRPRAGVNGDVVYHMHGRNLDEHIWNDDSYYTGMLQEQWQHDGTVPPTVVTLSYGKSWILAPKGKQPASGLLDDVIAQLPEIEKKTGKPRHRILLGESMGGLNVLIAGLSYPSKFDKVASLCPGVYKVSPYDSLPTIRSAMERTGADPKIIFGIWLMARKYTTDETEWQRIAPLKLIKSATVSYPALYLSNGLYDAYGNYEATRQLAISAQQNGVRTEWHPLYGGHCSVDIPSLASFLTR